MYPSERRSVRWLWLLVLLSLLPALLLAAARVQLEGASTTVTLLMDEPALLEQAAFTGTGASALAARYREQGLNGVALYEETLATLAASGRALVLSGPEARAAAALRGQSLDIPENSLLASASAPGALDGLLRKLEQPPPQVALAGRRWHVLSDPGAPGDPGDGAGLERPAGPDLAKLERYARAGWDIAYRPLNYPGLQGVGQDFPAEARYLIHGGLEVAGNPGALAETVAASQNYLTGLIEGTEQAGMAALVGEVPLVRVFSLSQDWLNTLPPAEAADKYLLAARERGARLLYLRPYTGEATGDMVANTEALVRALRSSLAAEGFAVGPVAPLRYEASPALRALAAVGVLAGLALLGTLYPGAWGAAVAAGVLGLGVAAGGLSWSALALVAALVFPVLGYAFLPGKLWSLGAATLVSVAGAVLLVAVGSDQQGLLAVTPFAGVAATLVVPPALFALHFALRHRSPARWVRELWGAPVRLGYVLVALVGVAGLALVVLRRGNFPVLGASELELTLRALLSEPFARPRFKELLGHPLAVLALLNPAWPAWVRGLLLTGGVVAQASVVNSFSHYHTPLLVSLERTAVALALGFALGLLLHLLAGVLVRRTERWLARAG